MFERYVPESRRAVFFARESALHENADAIAPRHLLLGLLIEHASRANTSLHLADLFPDIAARQRSLRPHPTPKDIPLTNESKRILAYASQEANYLADYWIDTDHLLLGILRERKSEAALMLRERGMQMGAARDTILQHRGSRPDYGPRPLIWSWSWPISHVGRWAGPVYLAAIILLIGLLGPRSCGGHLGPKYPK